MSTDTYDIFPAIPGLAEISNKMQRVMDELETEDLVHAKTLCMVHDHPGPTLVIAIIDSVLAGVQGIELALGIPGQCIPSNHSLVSDHLLGASEDISRTESLLQELFADEPLGIVIVMEGSDTGTDPFEELVLSYFLGDDASLKIHHNSSGKQHLDLSNGARISSSRGVQRKKNRFC